MYVPAHFDDNLLEDVSQRLGRLLTSSSPSTFQPFEGGLESVLNDLLVLLVLIPLVYIHVIFRVSESQNPTTMFRDVLSHLVSRESSLRLGFAACSLSTRRVFTLTILFLFI